MSVFINTNAAATLAANNLAASNGLLQRSLNRLSSGSKIVNPADDAGGLAVSMKLSAAARRQGATGNNLANTVSFLQAQDGALKATGKVLERIGELKTLASDPTKNAEDLANYNVEFVALQAQLTSLGQEKFNGIALFGSESISVATTEDGSGQITTDAVPLLGEPAFDAFYDDFDDFSNWSVVSGSGSASAGILWPSGGSMGEVATNRSFTGPMTIEFEAHIPGSGDMLEISLGSNSLAFLMEGSDLPQNTWTSVRIEIDDSGTASTYIGGSGAPAATQGGLSGASGGIHLMNIGLGSVAIRDFSVVSNDSTAGVTNVTEAGSLQSLTLGSVTDAISQTATYRAQNGASQSRLGFASEVLAVNKANLEAANSRIVDVDVAEESTALARYNILTQAGTAMLAQANQSTQIALRLIG